MWAQVGVRKPSRTRPELGSGHGDGKKGHLSGHLAGQVQSGVPTKIPSAHRSEQALGRSCLVSNRSHSGSTVIIRKRRERNALVQVVLMMW